MLWRFFTLCSCGFWQKFRESNDLHSLCLNKLYFQKFRQINDLLDPVKKVIKTNFTKFFSYQWSNENIAMLLWHFYPLESYLLMMWIFVISRNIFTFLTFRFLIPLAIFAFLLKVKLFFFCCLLSSNYRLLICHNFFCFWRFSSIRMLCFSNSWVHISTIRRFFHVIPFAFLQKKKCKTNSK